jgi:hypothetical protein
MKPYRSVATTLTAFLAAWLAVAAVVSAHSPDPVFSGERWAQNQALSFAWRSGSVPDATRYQPAIKAAAADASNTRRSQAATFAYAAGASNLVGYGVAATCGPQGIACFTRNAPYGFTMWMREQGHLFDWGSLRWCQAYSSPPNGCYDVETVMLDEFGHVEILNHHGNYSDQSDYTDAVVQAASRTKPNAGWNAHEFGRCDVATLQMQYDMQGWGAPYSTCLDLSTVLTLTMSQDHVPCGTTSTFTSTLRTANVTSYVRLASNPVALRTVILQRRPIGAASWTSVGAIPYTAPSGTYRVAATVPISSEFRAVFSKPADEGLRTSTSPLVRVTCR